MIRRIVVLSAAVLAVGAVVAADRLPQATVPAPEPYAAEVTPAVQPLACPGPVEIPVGEIDSGDPSLGSGSDERTYQALGAERASAGAGYLVRGDVGASVERVGSGDVAGLAATACASPAREQWLVGGSTSLGASARLVLTNPTDASTEVTVTYYGPLGESAERSVVSLAPGAQQDLLVEGVVAEVPALVMRVVATGAGVVAHLQDSRLDGFQPAGTDWVAAGSAPGDRLVVPGVGGDGSTGVLRVMAPEGATVALTLVGDDGIVEWGGVQAVVLEPGVVTEVAVPEIESGAIEIRADAPVVAAAMERVDRPVVDGPANSVASDLAWTAAQALADPMPRSAMVTDHVRAVSVHASTAGAFVLTDAGGDVVVAREMAARSTARIPLDLPAGTVLTAEGDVTWALVVEDEPGFISRIAPRRTDVQPLAVAVGQRGYVGTPAP